jgi:hypothetical protein
MRYAGIVSTLKLECATFGVWNGAQGAFVRRDISIRIKITDLSSKFESLHSAIFRDCFDPEIGVRYVRRVEWSGKSV